MVNDITFGLDIASLNNESPGLDASNTVLPDEAESKLLKEWGADQDTNFTWCLNAYALGNQAVLYRKSYDYCEYPGPGDVEYAAYTLGELIDWLPEGGCYSFTGPSADPSAVWQAARLNGYANGKGETLIEAVFNLCRALHEKGEA